MSLGSRHDSVGYLGTNASRNREFDEVIHRAPISVVRRSIGRRRRVGDEGVDAGGSSRRDEFERLSRLTPVLTEYHRLGGRGAFAFRLRSRQLQSAEKWNRDAGRVGRVLTAFEFADCRVKRDASEDRHLERFAQSVTATRVEEVVDGAALGTAEPDHVFDDTEDWDVVSGEPLESTSGVVDGDRLWRRHDDRTRA
jgi:hypothetical protein